VTGVVVDASVALAWGFPDEGSAYADGVLEGLEQRPVLVPALWALEIANGLVVGERRKRLQQAEISRFVALLEGLTIIQDERSVNETMTGVVPLAREHKLSAYDAAYLDLAIREGVPLATLDNGLRKAAKAAGVRIYGKE
jgi:predicted nucleic acid-binding protein